tara:strand:+ start:275 stop:1678 length:1404 start_codon:yes stop_codon:yes gene_type:complete
MSPNLFSHANLDKLKQKAQKTLNRSLDQHVKLAVTGLSGSGKTAFITALVKHLTTQTNKQNLPFFDVVKDDRLIAAKQVPQSALDIPTFDYPSAINCLLNSEPNWPESTKRINTLTIAIRYETKHGLKQHVSPQSTLYLELIDYPGEWLIDLPMLEQDYASWSESMLSLLEKPEYSEYAQPFLSELEQFNSEENIDEQALKQLSNLYTQALKQLKAQTQLAYLQPGRQLIPGDLEDAPILLFFPCRESNDKENSQYSHLASRFEAYKKQVITPFYKNYFCEFDRQLVLVDVMSALNDGPQSLLEQKHTLQAVLQSFNYGRSNLIKRLFSPKIDKVLFAANKCDHVNGTQQVAIAQLLHDLVGEQANDMRFNGVQIETMAMSSVQSTLAKRIKEGDKALDCIYGKPLNEDEWLTYLPPEPPNHFITQSQWPTHGFEFISFAPLPSAKSELTHTRLDHALQFLIGDKLQ